MSAWADRKAAVQAEAEALEAAKEEAVIAERHAALAEKTEEEVLAELGLPNPDEMQAGDDFAAFMKAPVPAALRNRALRTLWQSDPVLANVDMLVDYGEDFTANGDVLGAVKTIYRVGKGMFRDEAKGDDGEAATPPAEETRNAWTLDGPEVDEGPAEALVEVTAPERVIEGEDAAAPMLLAPRRRMRFVFSQGDAPAATGTEK